MHGFVACKLTAEGCPICCGALHGHPWIVRPQLTSGWGRHDCGDACTAWRELLHATDSGEDCLGLLRDSHAMPWVLRVPVLCEQVTSARLVRTVATLRTPWHGLSSCKWRQELLSGLLCTCSHGMGCHLRYHTLGRCCPPWCDAGHGHGVGCAGCLPAIGIGVVRPALLLSARPWRGLFAPAIGIGVVRPALQPSI